MSFYKKLVTIALFVLIAGHTAASAALYDIDGREISLSSLKGKWVFINYWASWCHPCLEEIPELNQFYQQYKSSNVEMYGVNYDTLPISEQKQLIREIGIEYPNLSHDPSRLLRLGDIRGVPVTFVFNPEGKLVKKLYGPQSMQSLSQVMG